MPDWKLYLEPSKPGKADEGCNGCDQDVCGPFLRFGDEKHVRHEQEGSDHIPEKLQKQCIPHTHNQTAGFDNRSQPTGDLSLESPYRLLIPKELTWIGGEKNRGEKRHESGSHISEVPILNLILPKPIKTAKLIKNMALIRFNRFMFVYHF